jgi:hypothetical protein
MLRSGSSGKLGKVSVTLKEKTDWRKRTMRKNLEKGNQFIKKV